MKSAKDYLAEANAVVPRLAAEEAKEPELKEQNKDMALLQAGLAVLGGGFSIRV